MAEERLASKAKACYLANGLPDHSPLANMNPKLDLNSQCRTSPDRYGLRGAVVLCLHAKIDEFVQYETNQRGISEIMDRHTRQVRINQCESWVDIGSVPRLSSK